MKKFLLIALALIVAVSVFGNIGTQYNTLKEAKRQNGKIEKEIVDLKQRNQVLEQKIDYATSSAFIETEVRDKLALGRENDVWLKLKPEEDLNLFPKINEVEEIPKIRQWINLFTQ